MSDRIPVSGYNDQALTTPAVAMREIISGEDFDGEDLVFWLRGMAIGNEHATEAAVVELADQDEAVLTPANQRGVFICPPSATTVFDFSAPGLKFKTNITAATTGGTIGAYGVMAWGYKSEE
jgi:hypothetical protein